MTAIASLVLLALATVGAIVAFVALAIVGYAAWCWITKWLGRWQAERHPMRALDDSEVASNGRPHCERLVLMPLSPPPEKPAP
jgi:hypothetical protein